MLRVIVETRTARVVFSTRKIEICHTCLTMNMMQMRTNLKAAIAEVIRLLAALIIFHVNVYR